MFVTPTLRSCSPPAAAPRCRLSAASRAETVRISGQIDRLAVTQSFVLIADFKTNRPWPRAELSTCRRLTCVSLRFTVPY